MAPLRLVRPDEIESLEQKLDREQRERDREAREAEERARLELLEREGPQSELLDVPAAVVCLVCGEADCPGCEDQEQSRSGIVAIVAWERPGLPAWTRLWSTARSTTRDAETFFELMPDGPILPALRFAAVCELIAIGSVLVFLVPIALLLVPDFVRHVAIDPSARSIAARLFVLGFPASAGLMVLGHAMHGLWIDHGAVKQGARRARSRALRFGLYACGWDLVAGPFGAIVVAVKEGIRAGFSVLDHVSTYRPATQAFLRGCYRLEGERAEKASSSATAGIVIIMGLAVVTVIAAIAGVSLL
ncbi:MAG: hypothetical protein JST00_01360 [Deltaproteobacteria bacterium]|nr:hypothetical protein [Deltaproteobacteria bacterium]